MGYLQCHSYPYINNNAAATKAGHVMVSQFPLPLRTVYSNPICYSPICLSMIQRSNDLFYSYKNVLTSSEKKVGHSTNDTWGQVNITYTNLRWSQC